MGKVNALWMDKHLDLESHDVTGEAVMEAMAEAQAEGAPESTAHRLDVGLTFCEKCGRDGQEIHGNLRYDDCMGTPKAGPMVRVMKVRMK